MRYKKKIFIQDIIFSSISLTLIGLLVIILISIPLIKNIRKQINENRGISALNQEIKDLEKRNTELKGLINYLSSDQFAEEQARLNLNYKKEGEQVTIIKEKDSLGDSSRQMEAENLKSIYNIKGLKTEDQISKKNNIKKWINYFWN